MKPEDFRNDSDKIRLINFRVFETNIARLFDRLEKEGLEPILIKGWAAAQYYPKPWSRRPGDVDLAFKPEAVGQAEKFLEDYRELPVDVHSGLRHLDSVAFEDLFQNSVEANCGGRRIRVLRVEDHLRVLCVHWLNDGGANKERLWDIFYAIEQNREKFDWKRCLDIVSPRRRLWMESAIIVASEYLGLDIEDLPLDKKLKKETKWLLQIVEAEWQEGIRLLPLRQCMGDRKLLFQQVFKRIPPNPIQAIIELEKDLDARYRFRYQIQNVFTRLKPSIDRIVGNKK